MVQLFAFNSLSFCCCLKFFLITNNYYLNILQYLELRRSYLGSHLELVNKLNSEKETYMIVLFV